MKVYIQLSARNPEDKAEILRQIYGIYRESAEEVHFKLKDDHETAAREQCDYEIENRVTEHVETALEIQDVEFRHNSHAQEAPEPHTYNEQDETNNSEPDAVNEALIKREKSRLRKWLGSIRKTDITYTTKLIDWAKDFISDFGKNL